MVDRPDLRQARALGAMGITPTFLTSSQNQANLCGLADRAAANRSLGGTTASFSPISAGPSLPAGAPAISGGGGGISVVRGAGSVDTGEAVRGILKFVFVASMLFGSYDYVTNKTDAAHSATVAAGTIYGFSDAIGRKVERIDPGPVFAWAGWVIRWGIAIPGGAAAYAGAGIGNFGSQLVNDFCKGYASSRDGVQTSQTVQN